MKLLKETIAELKKVTFPSRKKLIKDTCLVVNVCLFSSLFVFGVDSLLQIILTLLINLK